MRKTINLIALTVFLILQLSSCTVSSQNSSEAKSVINPGKDIKKPELSIITLKDQSVKDSDFFSSYKARFEREYGVSVNYITIDWMNKEDYYKKLAVMLSKKDGAELILYQWYDMNALVSEKAVTDLRGRVPNLEKVYSSLLKEGVYYAPVGMSFMGMALNKKVLDEIEMAEPGLDWTEQEYITIRDRWLAEAERPFTRDEFYYCLNKYMHGLQVFDKVHNKAHINSAAMKELIRNVRNDIFSGNYKLNKSYKCENYYNLLFEGQSEESQEGWAYLLSDEYSDSSLRNHRKENFCNILVSENNDNMLKYYNLSVLPRFVEEASYMAELGTWGLLVNKNGKEQELAYEFINGLLSDKVQLQLLDRPIDIFCHYPVIKSVEPDIARMEKEKQLSAKAIDLRLFALDKIKNGELDMDFYIDEKEYDLQESIIRDISKYIFADREYSEEELTKELQGLEDEYNIRLNE